MTVSQQTHVVRGPAVDSPGGSRTAGEESQREAELAARATVRAAPAPAAQHSRACPCGVGSESPPLSLAGLCHPDDQERCSLWLMGVPDEAVEAPRPLPASENPAPRPRVLSRREAGRVPRPSPQHGGGRPPGQPWARVHAEGCSPGDSYLSTYPRGEPKRKRPAGPFPNSSPGQTKWWV